MRQQLIDLTVFVGGQPSQYILEIDIGVMPIHAGRLNQTHDGARPLPGSE